MDTFESSERGGAWRSLNTAKHFLYYMSVNENEAEKLEIEKIREK